uniref:CA domain-containing protein n=1 Tax=Gongylonema pulchrum TaxID=637853 RepID=A0A183EHF8_9BILA
LIFPKQFPYRTYPANSGFASVSPETATGTTVAVVTVSDPDDGQNARVTITDGNEEDYFRLESGKNFAILRLNRLVADKPIERFLLKFRAVDDGSPARFSERDLKIFVLNLNDTAPLLESELIEASIYENSIAGSFVAAVRAVHHRNLHFSAIDDDEDAELFDVL